MNTPIISIPSVSSTCEPDFPTLGCGMVLDPETLALLWAEHEATQAEARSRVDRTNALVEKWQKETLSFCGEAKYRKWRRYVREQQIKAGPADGLRSVDRAAMEAAAQKRRSLRTASLKAMRAAGIDPVQFTRINANHRSKIHELIVPKSFRENGVHVTKGNGEPDPNRPKDLDTWFSKKPPFDTWGGSASYYYTAGLLDITARNANKANGAVGHKSIYFATDTGGGEIFVETPDIMWMFCEERLGFLIKSQGPAKLDLFVTAKCVGVDGYMTFGDEVGNTDWDSQMESYFNFRVTPSVSGETLVRTKVWGWSQAGDDDWSASVVPIQPGQSASAWLDGLKVGPGTTFVRVGVEDYRTAGLDDASTAQWMNNLWMFTEIQWRLT